MIINTNNILLIGDPHLSAATPRSRIDDYRATCLKKWNYLREYCLQNEVGVVIMAGDVFHKPVQPTEFVNDVMALFASFQQAGIRVFSIVGNHDIPHEDLQRLGGTSLQTMFLSGVIEHLTTLRIEPKQGNPLMIVGVDQPDEIPANEYKEKSLVVVHRFYGNQPDKQTLHAEDIESLGYDIYFCGHDHEAYPIVKIGSQVILRCGSFTRGTSHQYNLDNKPAFYHLRINGEKFKVDLVPLPCEDAQNVFSAQAFDKTKKEDEGNLAVKLEELVERLGAKATAKTDVYALLDELDITSKVRHLMEDYLLSEGIINPKL